MNDKTKLKKLCAEIDNAYATCRVTTKLSDSRE
jgi:hypothetical protein